MTQPQEPTPEPTPTPEIIYPQGPPGGFDYGDGSPMWPQGQPGPDGTWQVPQYPPYIPESQFDASQGMPRSTLDGIHGTGDDEPIRWSPSFEGELPPYWMNDYVQDTADPDLWWPDKRPYAPGSVLPASAQSDNSDNATSAQPAAAGGNKLDVNPADLNNVADQYRELQMRAAAIGPQAVEEVNRIIASHGAMGYPVAVGVVAGLARRQARLEAKANDFGVYAGRFDEHAAAYKAQDHDGVAGYQSAQFVSASRTADPWDWDGESDESWMQPIDPGGAAAGPNAGPAIPSSLI
uniref:Uncharacterized protein n=2 Tax=unclassified Mycobacterium TaxID=2642494 RepID=A0A5Q5BTI6_MYCSS